MTAQPETTKTETAAQPETTKTETAAKVKTQVSATLSPELFAKLEDYRWENRINKTSEIVAKAVEHFLNSQPAKK